MVRLFSNIRPIHEIQFNMDVPQDSFGSDAVHVSMLVPRYFPNLQQLKFSKHIDADQIVIGVLDPRVYGHDAAAALQLCNERCPTFQIPRKLFARHAPLNKITFLPMQMLPPEYDAGGVFPAGVLSHKLYPAGLLRPGHRGQTPPLFVGLRGPETKHVLHTCAVYVGMPYCQTYSRMSDGKNGTGTETGTAIGDLGVGFIVAHPNTLAKACTFVKAPTLCRNYVPDLSSVRMMVHSPARVCVTVLSDVLHPHAADVGRAMACDQAATFQLPKELASVTANGLRREPVFLAQRYLPPGFEAGCVFGPGLLPANLFLRLLPDAPAQLQHNKAMMPPVFFGQWRGQRTPKEFIFPQQKTPLQVAATQTDDTGTEQLQQAKPKQELEEEEQEEASVEMPSAASEKVTIRELDKLLPKNAVKGLWFFSLYGQEEDIDSLLRRLGEAGVKLASDVAEQTLIRRAHEQFVVLNRCRDEIRAKMAHAVMRSRPRRAHVVRHSSDRPPWKCVKCECGSIDGPNML